MDSAYYGRDAVHAAITGGAAVSVTVRLDPAVKAAIASIEQGAWTPIRYPNAILDEATGTWVSKAEVAEVPYTAFVSRKKAERVTGRLVVRRIPDVHASRKQAAGQGTLFDLWRFHAFFTTVPADQLDAVAADSTHRGHAIIEQVHADHKASALAHLPSGRFTANSAWLVLAVIAFNLTRAARRPARSPGAGQGDHRHCAPQADPRSGPGRDLGPPDHAAPAPALAMAAGMDPPVRPGRRPTRHRLALTTQPSTARPEEPPTWNTPTPRSGDHPRP